MSEPNESDQGTGPDKKLVVDEDWKTQVEAEKEALQKRVEAERGATEEDESADAPESAPTASADAPEAPEAPSEAPSEAVPEAVSHAAAEESASESGSESPADQPAKTARPEQAEPELPPASFATLVSMLATQAMFALGQGPALDDEGPKVHAELARHYIDSLTMLEAKTKGNLDDDEQAILTNVLHELRMAFIRMAK